jgi:hypothetical protein
MAADWGRNRFYTEELLALRKLFCGKKVGVPYILVWVPA